MATPKAVMITNHLNARLVAVQRQATRTAPEDDGYAAYESAKIELADALIHAIDQQTRAQRAHTARLARLPKKLQPARVHLAQRGGRRRRA